MGQNRVSSLSILLRFLFEGDQTFSDEEVVKNARANLGIRLPEFLQCTGFRIEHEEMSENKVTRLVVCELKVLNMPPREVIEEVMENLRKFDVELTVQRAVVQAAEDAFVQASNLDEFSFFDTQFEEDFYYGTVASVV